MAIMLLLTIGGFAFNHGWARFWSGEPGVRWYVYFFVGLFLLFAFAKRRVVIDLTQGVVIELNRAPIPSKTHALASFEAVTIKEIPDEGARKYGGSPRQAQTPNMCGEQLLLQEGPSRWVEL